MARSMKEVDGPLTMKAMCRVHRVNREPKYEGFMG